MENEVVEDTRARRGITSADVDRHGNVVVWDHGPQEPGSEPGMAYPAEDHERLVAEHKAWHHKHGDGPVPITMAHADARHAMEVEPVRYAMEPDRVSENEVEAEIENIRKQRVEAEKVAAERAEAVQLAADRKTAIGVVIARRRAEQLAPKPVEPPVEDYKPEVVE